MPDALRPGGLSITERALELIMLKSGGRVLDIGCGGGATVSLLRKRGFDAYGVDIALTPDSPPELIHADAASLPFPDSSMDAVFFECSLSKTDHPDAAIREASRVLKPDGKLSVSDLFTHGEARCFEGLLGRLEPWPVIAHSIESTGFRLRVFEEHGDALSTFWGQLVFDYGLKEASNLLCGGVDALKASDNSYFLAVFDVK